MQTRNKIIVGKHADTEDEEVKDRHKKKADGKWKTKYAKLRQGGKKGKKEEIDPCQES